jgi:aerobic carbon-monoxide dehydrogenase medium subunit
MKPAPFAYHAPASQAEAVALLGEFNDARVLAGGQSLVPLLNFRKTRCAHLVDLNEVPELAGLHCTDGRFQIGAMTRQRDLAESAVIAEAAPVTPEALQWVGHLATRTRGTLGGSLCNLDPTAELYSVSLLHDAVLHVSSTRGDREVAIASWPAGYMSPALEADELLTHISWRMWPTGHGHGFVEFSKRHHDYAIATAAALLTATSDERIDEAAVVVGGVQIAPVRLAAAEAMLAGQPGDPALFAEAAQTCTMLEPFAEEIAAQSYPRRFVSAGYRKHLAAVLTRRALELAWARATTKETDHDD